MLELMTDILGLKILLVCYRISSRALTPLAQQQEGASGA